MLEQENVRNSPNPNRTFPRETPTPLKGNPRRASSLSLLARKERSDGIAKNERQLWVLHHFRTGTAKKTG